VTARTLMVQGTASSVGKSAGLRVAPFKAQNMALNAGVTASGHEIGRAQLVQAEAAGVCATVDMNPILLKPEAETRSQVVVQGKPVGSMTAREYHGWKPVLRRTVAEALERLRAAYELVVIEGAGSPAEINLRAHDIVNMDVAHLADAPVLLVGDIDRGGVFASLVGTLDLLDDRDRARVEALVVNKFRGDPALLAPGLEFLHRRTGTPVLGVLPYVACLRLPEEDSVALDERPSRVKSANCDVDVAVVRLPRIANYDDVLPLECEMGVGVRFVDGADAIKDADLVIVPGSKSTVADLMWLQDRGLARAIADRAARGRAGLGICGGCEMLGEALLDPDGVESDRAVVAGIGVLPIVTRFGRHKTTARVRARVSAPSFLSGGRALDVDVEGYEIHMASVDLTVEAPTPFHIMRRNGVPTAVVDGAIGAGGAVVGTMIHGLLENDVLRSALLSYLRAQRDLPAPAHMSPPSRDAEYRRIAAMVGEHLDIALLYRLVGIV
jgi:adenosylcobyric acid synthase